MDGVAEGVVLRGVRDAFSEDNGEPFAKPYASPSDQRSHLHCHRIHQRNRPRNRQVFLFFVFFWPIVDWLIILLIWCSNLGFERKWIGFDWDRQLAESGAHVVMAVRNTKAAHELIQKWQSEWSGMGLPLNIEVSLLRIHFCQKKKKNFVRI